MMRLEQTEILFHLNPWAFANNKRKLRYYCHKFDSHIHGVVFVYTWGEVDNIYAELLSINN